MGWWISLSTGVASILTFSPFSKPCSQAQSTRAALMACQVEWRMRERFSARVERAGVQPKGRRQKARKLTESAR